MQTNYIPVTSAKEE